MHREAPSIRAAALHQLEKNHYSAAINGLCAVPECMQSIFSHLPENLMTTIRAPLNARCVQKQKIHLMISVIMTP